jgi:hypothetical protein
MDGGDFYIKPLDNHGIESKPATKIATKAIPSANTADEAFTGAYGYFGRAN